ncbi:MAG: response regulator [Methyloceanibacter sp.]
MLHHRALGCDLDKLAVAVIDNRRPMLSMMRAMLAAIGTGRIDTYESPTDALVTMAQNAPDLVIASAAMQPLAGSSLVRTMRHLASAPLCFIPAMIMSANAKPSLVEEALRAGAHQVLVLPTSASTLYRRLDWLLNDDRPFELRAEHYVVAGMEERLALNFPRPTYIPAPVRAPIALAEEPVAAALPYALRLRAAQN